MNSTTIVRLKKLKSDIADDKGLSYKKSLETSRRVDTIESIIEDVEKLYKVIEEIRSLVKGVKWWDIRKHLLIAKKIIEIIEEQNLFGGAK